MLMAIEQTLHQAVERANGAGLGELNGMLAYHLGWEGEGAGPEASGKRLRPLIVLLTTAAAGGDWRQALPAAAAIELIHNFSLIHDDIEDDSPLRRGRPTVWAKWGIAQAINTGDAMFTLAHLAVLELERTAPLEIVLRACQIVFNACLHLTQGQYLDISFEKRSDLKVEDYWPMVSGKTAALIGACTELGALIAGANQVVLAAYRQFGISLGLAFQTQDDLLGIWGDAALTGKSADSDLVSGKKSLPVLFGLGQRGEFARRWAEGSIQPAEVRWFADQLEAEGSRSFGEEKAATLTEQALQALEKAGPQGEAGRELHALALKLLKRQV